MAEKTIAQQIKNNLIAIISMAIAVSSLAYNTWRNEQTEYNRNIRTSSFEILMSLAELQLLVDYAFYSESSDKHDPIKGWSYVLYVQDLSQAVSTSTVQQADALHTVWSDHWQDMEKQEASAKAINKVIDDNRRQILVTLKSLQ